MNKRGILITCDSRPTYFLRGQIYGCSEDLCVEQLAHTKTLTYSPPYTLNRASIQGL